MKSISLSFLMLTTLFTLQSFTHAEDHELSTITGTSIDLKAYDHSIAGSVKNFVMWGDVNESTFTSTLLMKKDGQVIQAIFNKKEDGRIGGEIEHSTTDRIFKTSIYFTKLDKENAKYSFMLNNKPVEVSVVAERFENNHFINPTYFISHEDGNFEFTLKGQACYAYSLHLLFLIMGAYFH